MLAGMKCVRSADDPFLPSHAAEASVAILCFSFGHQTLKLGGYLLECPGNSSGDGRKPMRDVQGIGLVYVEKR